ncbi:outer membrane protein [Neochlamydia sp. S13]|uniref:outer membrane protein n=1 Tax=Neochlamydia sp. S13 TaxID=1353976 RepID=UPI0005A8470E|nr:outer membrane beta-barrel protein [Neochlamydia sp. S13]BBI16909.1 Putative outer membrane protein [Neochlamydia sp. S13]
MKKFVLLTILFAAFLVPQCVKAVDMEGFYVGATGAANFLQHAKKHRGKYDTGYFGTVDLGYRWCNRFHLEAEVAYRYNKGKKRHHYHNGDLVANHRHRGHRDTWAAMVNVLYDFDMQWTMAPYVGVGIGYAHIKNERHYNYAGYAQHRYHKNDNQFAWHAIAGVAYPIYYNVDLAVEYRFFDTTTRRHERSNYNHDVGVNLKYYF